MRGTEKGLAVVAQRGAPPFEQAEHELVGVGLYGAAHLLHERGVDAVLIVFDGSAGHAHGEFKGFVFDGVAVVADGVYHAVAQPFAQSGQLAQPGVLLGAGGAGHGGSDLAVLASGLPQTDLEGRVEGGVEGFEVGVVDVHGAYSLNVG